MSAPLLEVSELRTSFPGRGAAARAVDGVSFRVAGGESVGLVGESGCGKSVTALSLPGLVPPPGRIDPGSSVRFRGRELVGAPARELRRIRGRELALVFQDPGASLDPVLPAGPQIAEVLAAHGVVRGADARDRVRELLEAVGLRDPERAYQAYPHELSGGMRQRVGIAAAVACGPGLLVADEPTTALDVTIQAQVLDLLDRLREETDMALLLITHDLAVVGERCDRVLVMYAGRIVESGPVEEVFTRPAHPYTAALLAAVPRRGGGTLRPIPGRPPSPVERPGGCAFAPRCSHAWDRCAAAEPPLLDAGEGRSSRCWLAAEGRLDEVGR